LHFRLHEKIPHWIEAISKYVPREIAIWAFAIAGGIIALVFLLAGIRIGPYVWQEGNKRFRTWLKWQVRQVFERVRWAAHTVPSTEWTVLCGLAASTAVVLWINLPILRPLIYVLVPLSLLVFAVLAWNERGPRATGSFHHRVKFFWAFFLTTGAYTALTSVGALMYWLLEFL